MSVLISVCHLDSSIESNTRIAILEQKLTTAFRMCEPGDVPEGWKSVAPLVWPHVLQKKENTVL